MERQFPEAVSRRVGGTAAAGADTKRRYGGFHRGYVILTALFNRPFSTKTQIKRLLRRNYSTRSNRERDKCNGGAEGGRGVGEWKTDAERDAENEEERDSG